jgi:predicted phage replisome organizer
MADGKYYWLKLKRDFFKRHDIQIIEDMPNGKEYILFYLKLLCESVDHEGDLRFSEQIPYSESMLATITRTNIDIVRAAIQVFTGLNMMEIMDDGTYFMSEVHKMLGSAADNPNANRQRRFRERQKELALQESYGAVTNSNESKSIEIEKDIELDIPPYSPPKGDNGADNKQTTLETAEKKTKDTSRGKTIDTQFERFWKAYPKKKGKDAARKSFKRVTVPVETLLDAIEKQKTWSEWQRDNGQYIPNPSTWLNQGRWEDEEYHTGTTGRKTTEIVYKGGDFFDD